MVVVLWIYKSSGRYTATPFKLTFNLLKAISWATGNMAQGNHFLKSLYSFDIELHTAHVCECATWGIGMNFSQHLVDLKLCEDFLANQLQRVEPAILDPCAHCFCLVATFRFGGILHKRLSRSTESWNIHDVLIFRIPCFVYSANSKWCIHMVHGTDHVKEKDTRLDRWFSINLTHTMCKNIFAPLCHELLKNILWI